VARQRGVILTYVETLDQLEECVRAGDYNAVKVVTGWGLASGWSPEARARVLKMVPNVIVRTVSGDPSYARPFDSISGARPGAIGPNAQYWDYDFPDPNTVEQEIGEWYGIRPNIMIEIGNEPNVYNQDDDFIWRWNYFLDQAIQRCRERFPQAKLISPGFMMDPRGKIARFYEIAHQTIAKCDYIGVHFYEYYAFKPDQGPVTKGELRDAVALHQRFFNHKQWYVTEYGINDSTQTAQSEKGRRYAALVHAGEGFPALPPNVVGAVYYHLACKGDLHPEYHIFPEGDRQYKAVFGQFVAQGEGDVLGGGIGATQNRVAFHTQLEEAQRVLGDTASLSAQIDAVIAVVAEAALAGKTIFSCGNGGSATDANHLAQELVGRYRSDRRPLAGLSLNADSAALTCIANDFGYEQVFARQLEGLAQRGDVLVVFSTSGSSPNILTALQAARARGVTSIALLGKQGGPARELADHSIVVPSDNTARIQELHTLILHAICEEIEQRVG
jgi:D-sedoheptulose 7-phosphate isomerase